MALFEFSWDQFLELNKKRREDERSHKSQIWGLSDFSRDLFQEDIGPKSQFWSYAKSCHIFHTTEKAATVLRS